MLSLLKRPLLFSLPMVFSSLFRRRRDVEEHFIENGSFPFKDLSATHGSHSGLGGGDFYQPPLTQHIQTVSFFFMDNIPSL